MKVIVVFSLLLLAAQPALPQKTNSANTAPPDFSGTWQLDLSKSNVDDNIKDYVLTIVHREPEINFSKRYKRGKREVKEDYKYYTDGRPQFVARPSGDATQPDVRWRGKTLSIKTVTRMPMAIDSVTVEEWKLSDDQRTLVRTIRSTGLSGEIKAVFVRQP